MRAGMLRHRVQIQQVTETQDSFGAVVQTWGTVATVWASIEAISGREFFDAAQTNAEITHRIRIRYRPGIAPAMRVVEGTRTFDIQAVLDPGGRRRELVLMVKEAV